MAKLASIERIASIVCGSSHESEVASDTALEVPDGAVIIQHSATPLIELQILVSTSRNLTEYNARNPAHGSVAALGYYSCFRTAGPLQGSCRHVCRGLLQKQWHQALVRHIGLPYLLVLAA